MAILGCGGHAKCVAEIAQLQGWRIACFLDDSQEEDSLDALMAIEIRRGADLLPKLLSEGISSIAIAIGDCHARFSKIKEAEALGLHLPSLVHPSATVSPSARIGVATVVSAGCVVQIDATLGAGTIVNTGATVDHDCCLGEAVHLSPGVHLAGNVTVGRRTWIGIGTVVRERIRIGSDSVIGANSTVLRDLPDCATAWGGPARIQHHRKPSQWQPSNRL